MRIGVILPQTEIGPTVGAVRAYGIGVEELGFQHMLAYDHVVGRRSGGPPGWNGPYDIDTQFHEPFVAVRLPRRLHLARAGHRDHHPPPAPDGAGGQTGRRGRPADRGGFRLGVGLGWNPVEYEALGQDFATRGRRIEEQVPCSAQLWTEPVGDLRRRVRHG